MCWKTLSDLSALNNGTSLPVVQIISCLMKQMANNINVRLKGLEILDICDVRTSERSFACRTCTCSPAHLWPASHCQAAPPAG